MAEFSYIVTVYNVDSKEQADRVMAERLHHDDDYGFPYNVDYEEK